MLSKLPPVVRLMLRVATLVLGLLGFPIATAAAQDAPRGSECLAMGMRRPGRGLCRCAGWQKRRKRSPSLMRAIDLLHRHARGGGDRNRLQWRLYHRPPARVVTINRAHSTHYTLFPDPRIPHVLHGWNDDGSPARINERIGDVLIPQARRQPFRGDRPARYRDGPDRRNRSLVGLPMTVWTPLDEFMRRIGQQFEIDQRTERSFTISRDSLPSTPTASFFEALFK